MFNHSKLIKAVALVNMALLASLAVTACAPATAPGSTVVSVTMEEWNLKPSLTSIPAGKVTFQVANQGKVTHELVILKTDLAVASLKMLPSQPDKVDEEGLAQNVGEVEDIDPGETKSGTFDLSPGHYLLICNEASHYQAGMVAAFEVK